jgi:hypothetical protein
MPHQAKPAGHLIEVNAVALPVDLRYEYPLGFVVQVPLLRRISVGLRQSQGMPRNLPVVSSPDRTLAPDPLRTCCSHLSIWFSEVRTGLRQVASCLWWKG